MIARLAVVVALAALLAAAAATVPGPARRPPRRHTGGPGRRWAALGAVSANADPPRRLTVVASRGAPRTPVTARQRSTPTATAGPGRDLGLFTATCYGLESGTRTATGTRVAPGTIAVDPTVIPLGTRLVVDGYGPGRALDTGGAIRGRRIDVWIGSPAACAQWGRRTVHVRETP